MFIVHSCSTQATPLTPVVDTAGLVTGRQRHRWSIVPVVSVGHAHDVPIEVAAVEFQDAFPHPSPNTALQATAAAPWGFGTFT